MPLSSSRSVSNKNTQKGGSQREAIKMQASNVKDEPFSWTEPSWDSLQFQSRENRDVGRVKKLTKTVATNFPYFEFRTCPSPHPFQGQRNAQGGQEHEESKDHYECKRRLPLRCGLATKCSFSTPRTTLSNLVMGNERVAAISKCYGQHSSNGEVSWTTHKRRSQEIILLQRALCQLDELNLQAVTNFQNLTLIERKTRKNTDCEVTEGVQTLIGNVGESVEAILIRISDELVSAKSSIIHNNTANRSTEEMKRNALVEYLRQSLSDICQTVSEHIFQAIMLLAGSLHESRQIQDHVQASVHSLAFECIHLQDRLFNAEQNMISKIYGWTLAIENTDQEKKRTDKGLKLTEAVCSNVIQLQHKLLQTCFVDQNENKASFKETENLDLHLQLSWSWLQELQKSIAILYPENERCLYDRFMDTLVIVLESIFQHLNVQHIKDHSSIENMWFDDDDLLSQKRVLASLSHLHNIFEKAMTEIEQNPALDFTDFSQIQNFCDSFFSLLTVLYSRLTSTSASNKAEHHILTESRLDCRAIVLKLAQLYLRGSVSNIHKDNKAIEAVTTMVEKLTQNVKYSEMMLLSHEDALVQDCHSPSSSQAAFDEQTNLQKESLVSSDISSHGKDLFDYIEDLERTASFQTPFANPQTYPDILESINECNGNIDKEQAMDRSDCILVRTEDVAPLNDASLDLSLGSLPSSGFFNRIGVNEVSEMKYLDEGSSGLVTVGKLGNLRVAIKESKCPDPDKRLKRLNREAKIHQKINSCLSIVRFVGRLVKPNENGEDQIVGIITEWCELGDLYTAIRQAAWIQDIDRDGEDSSFMKDSVGYQLYKNWKKRLEIVVDIATAMVYMHNCYVVHRDLTCKNVLLYTVDKSGEFGAKVCDFERARYLPGGKDVPRTKSCANSAPWMGPEVLRNEFYGLKADVYSIGTILWELMYLENPWTHLKERFGNSEANILCLLRSGGISLSISETDGPEEVQVFPQLIDLIKFAWEADPYKRPTMTEFLCRLKAIVNCVTSI